jgi:hypothetical protein
LVLPDVVPAVLPDFVKQYEKSKKIEKARLKKVKSEKKCRSGLWLITGRHTDKRMRQLERAMDGRRE